MRIDQSVPFKLQHDQYDCGVACLRNILNYYRAEISLEKLREWSGAGRQGTTLIGLHQAATQSGFMAKGVQANSPADLRELKSPCILPVTPDGQLMHYVVYYPDERSDYLIGDPATGLVRISGTDLTKIWTSKTLLLLEPGERLSQWQQQRKKKFSWLLTSLSEDMHLLYVALALGAVCSLLNLSIAIFSQQLIDHILPARRLSTLYLGLGSLGLLLIMKGLISFFRQDLLIRQGYRFNLRITGNFFRSIRYLNKSFFDHRQTGDLTARLGDTLRIQQAISYILGDMGVQVLLMLVSLTFLFIYSWPIALGCLVMIPVVFCIVKYYEGDVAGFFQSFQDAILRLGKTWIRFGVFLEIVTSLFLFLIIGWASLRVTHGGMHTGGLIAIIQLAGLLMQTVISVALTNLQVQEAGVALDRMYEFTMLEPEFEIPAAGTTSVIVVSGGSGFVFPEENYC